LTTTEPIRGGRPRLLISTMKCLALLEALAAEPGPVGVSALARQTNEVRGTTHQRLQTLVASGWVEPVGDGKYRLTLRAMEVGNAVLEQADLGSRVLPTLTSLAGQTGETSSLAVLDHEAALIIQRVAADHALRVDIKAGTRMPLEPSASGRVLVSFCNYDELLQLRRARITLPSQAIIEQVRAVGYASQHDEYIAGMSSAAVPIQSTKLGLVALAITAPSSRYDERAALQALESGAKEIASLLGEAD
jgi:DNA-binding IclR family transcriptional regulator